MASFPDRAVEHLRELGVNTVVLHPDLVDGTVVGGLARAGRCEGRARAEWCSTD